MDSTDSKTALFLRKQLDADRFRIVNVDRDAGFEAMARETHPQIAVIDQIHLRPELARARLGALKEICPDVRVIIVSERPSARDGTVVEQGVFYYLTLPVGPELLRVIEAAARASGDRTLRQGGAGP